jgi:hypothetical protein
VWGINLAKSVGTLSSAGRLLNSFSQERFGCRGREAGHLAPQPRTKPYLRFYASTQAVESTSAFSGCDKSPDFLSVAPTAIALAVPSTVKGDLCE